MIVPMKQLSLLCLANDKQATLEALRELGVMHITTTNQFASDDRTKIEAQVTALEKIHNVLAERKIANNAVSTKPALSAEAIIALLDEQEKNNRQLDSLHKSAEQLLPWGNFSSALISSLKERGINIALCQATEKQYQELIDQGLQCQLISQSKIAFYFAVISEQPLDIELPLATLPENNSLAEIQADISKLSERNKEIAQTLNQAAENLAIYSDELAKLESEAEFLRTRDGMVTHEQIAILNGYIPAPEEARLIASSKEHGWGLLLTEPEDMETVPTLTKVPKIFSIIKPVFEFIGISPGYNEMDVSIVFLLFFILFFSMIIGDAGYGSLFLLAAIVCKIKFRDPKFKLPINLFITLSTMTIVWGGINGNWFGLSAPGLKFFTDPSIKDQNVQLVCFVLAVAQLTIGRIWHGIKIGTIRGGLGQLGWILVLWGNFFLTMKLIVFPGVFPVYMYYLYVIGFVLVAACDVNWTDMGDVFNFPFGAIGSFVDMLSYIRLFAVGMAGFYIAKSFNDMAMNLVDSSPWPIVGIAGAIVVLLFGHILNILLCLMGVLVHGIRLNTLEFSNHIGLRWAGFVYQPFKKKEIN
jgi:V/A-type H+-transporting ATPase subunit I